MSRVYEALKGVVQESLHRSKANSIFMARSKDSEGLIVNDKMEELQEIVADWIDTLKAAVEEREAVVAGEVQRTEQAIENLKGKIAVLEAKLTNTQAIVQAKESTIKGLEQDINAKIQELENQARSNSELLAERERQVNDLKSKLKLVKNGINETSSFFRQVEEALAAVDAQDIATPVPAEELTRKGEKPVDVQFNAVGGKSNAVDAAQGTVPRKFFDRMTVALSHVLGPKASTVVRDHVAALGESMERFPKARVKELIEIVSQEIPDDNLKIGFREVLGESR